MGMRTGPLLLVVAVLLALAGCVPSDPRATAAPTTSATPVFASDAEALAAAEKAYAAYLKVSDEIAHDGGANPERFSSTVTKAWLPSEIDSAEQLAKSGRRQIGSTSYSSLEVQQYVAGPGTPILVAYTCLNLSGTRVLDSNGTDVTPASRRLIQPVVVNFKLNAITFLVDKNEPWSGSDFC
ncbi:MAG: hypothetical protein M3N46_06215 [Actinomycetota bacterium]|nr:hypothetical protein [Actinomycetota bacterium]